MSTSRTVARNSALNVLGQSLPLLTAVVAIPPLIRGLGEDRFAVLTLAWATIGYFSLFEFGLSRGLTQAVAQRLGVGTDGGSELPAIARSGLALLFGLGILGAAILAILAPALVTRLLNVPEPLRAETIAAFRVLAACLPFVMPTIGMRGLLEAHQHFGMATLLRAPLIVFTFIGPLVALPFTNSLVVAIAIIAVGRVLAFVAHAVVCLRRYPYLRQQTVMHREPVLALLRFGGWMTVSNVVSPLMVYVDRFVIGATLSLTAVTAYVTPYELIVKLLVIPTALTGAALPALAATRTTDPRRMATLYDQSLRAVLLVMFPMVLVAIVLAHEGLHLWVGPLLPAESATILQWLAAGVFVTAIGQAPFAALQSAGRPDLIARVHLIELPLYAAGLVVLMRTFGLQGVAMAWTLRTILDASALTWLAHRYSGVDLLPRVGGPWPVLLMIAAMAAGASLTSTNARIAYLAAVGAFFVFAARSALLTVSERAALRDWVRRPAARPADLIDADAAAVRVSPPAARTE